MKSILDKDLIAGERDKKGGRPSNFFTPFSLFGEILMREHLASLFRVPRKVHYRSFWKHNQDAVYWLRLSLEHKIKVYKSGRRGLLLLW